MRGWNSILGRTEAATAQLDSLFMVPSAAITLQTAAGLTPTGSGSVCYRSAAGPAFAQTQSEIVALLNDNPEAPDVEVSTDSFGFTWLIVQRDPHDVAALCTDLHAVKSPPEDHGIGTGLLCSRIAFAADPARRPGPVSPHKQGRLYHSPP